MKKTNKIVQDAPAPEVEQTRTAQNRVSLHQVVKKMPDAVGHKWVTKNDAQLALFKCIIRTLGGDDAEVSTDTNTLFRFLLERIVAATLNGGAVTITADDIVFEDAEPLSADEWLQMTDADWTALLG